MTLPPFGAAFFRGTFVAHFRISWHIFGFLGELSFVFVYFGILINKRKNPTN